MTSTLSLNPVDRVIERLRDRGCAPKASGNGQWEARCPNVANHRNGDKNASLSVGTGAEGKVLVFCHKGCAMPDIARHLELNVHDLFPPRQPTSSSEGRNRITATYDYYDEDGAHVFQVVRYTPKGFGQRRRGPDGRWIYKINDVVTVRPLYQLPQVRRAIEEGKRVYLCEGEKDAEALQWAVMNGVATCNSGGATKWRDEYAHQLRGAKRITLFQDNDARGLEHVKVFAGKLLAAGFADVDVVAPPAPFKDVAEALGAGKTTKDFVHVWDNSEDMSWLIVDPPENDPPDAPDPDSDEEHTTELEDDDWSPIDLISIARQILDGTYQPTLPTVLAVEGAIPLFYRERVNLLFGESGGGKTWIALAALAETIAKGERALMIDYEDNPNGIAERLVILGVTLEQMQLIDYINPTRSMSTGWETLADTQHTYGVVILDSTGEAMAAGGVNSNDDGEVAQWFAIVKRFLRLPGKPAVITLDHVPKNQEGTLLFSIGSQRKRAAITGASYRVDTIKEPAKGRDGKLKLTVAKDRPGNRPKNTIACHVDLLSVDGRLTIVPHLEQPSVTADGKFRPTGYMERVSKWLEFHAGATAREIREGVTGKTTVINEALSMLVAEGYVRADPGARGSTLHYSVTPYAELTDSALTPADTNPGSRFPVVPCGSQEPGRKTEMSGSRFPPLKGEPGNHSDRGEKGPLLDPRHVPEESFGSLDEVDF